MTLNGLHPPQNGPNYLTKRQMISTVNSNNSIDNNKTL